MSAANLHCSVAAECGWCAPSACSRMTRSRRRKIRHGSARLHDERGAQRESRETQTANAEGGAKRWSVVAAAAVGVGPWTEFRLKVGWPLRRTGGVEGRGWGEGGRRSPKDRAEHLASIAAASTAGIGPSRRLCRARSTPRPRATSGPRGAAWASAADDVRNTFARGATRSARSEAVGGRFRSYASSKTAE